MYYCKHIATVILAAGKGTRMNSALAKVLHRVGGRPMLYYPVNVARLVGSEKIVVVIGYQAEQIRDVMGTNPDIVFVEQRAQLGTAHAVLQTYEILHDYDGTVLILCGDVPLLTLSTIQLLLEQHCCNKSVMTVLTTVLEDATGYGRVIKDRNGFVLKVVEDRDANEYEKQIKEINTGIYCVESSFLFDGLAKIGNLNNQSEFYFTDIFEVASRTGHPARAFAANDPAETMGINTLSELQEANRIIETQKNS